MCFYVWLLLRKLFIVEKLKLLYLDIVSAVTIRERGLIATEAARPPLIPGG